MSDKREEVIIKWRPTENSFLYNEKDMTGSSEVNVGHTAGYYRALFNLQLLG